MVADKAVPVGAVYSSQGNMHCPNYTSIYVSRETKIHTDMHINHKAGGWL